MTVKRKREYGYGRIQFIADLDRIRDELSAGLTLQSAYDKRADRLRISYSAFIKLARRYAGDARPQTVATNMKGQDVSQPKAGSGHSGHVDPAKIRKFTGA